MKESSAVSFEIEEVNPIYTTEADFQLRVEQLRIKLTAILRDADE